MGIFRCGALTAGLIGYSMESDGVCGEIIYIFGTWTGVLKSEWCWKVSKFVIKVLNELRCEKSCDHCMTLRYVPSRDDNRLIGQSTVICTGRQIGDCDQWSTDWRL